MTWHRLAFCSALAWSCAAPSTGAPPPSSPGAAASSSPRPSAAPPPAVAAAAAEGNPFLGARLYVDPQYVKRVEGTLMAASAGPGLLRKLEIQPTAFWLDSIAMTEKVRPVLDDALKQESAGGQPVVPVFVVYNLPNRDCAAKSSFGELDVADRGEERYRTDFIDRIAAQLRGRSQRVVLILEPDSLANMATNLNVPRCAASAAVYKRSIAYAVSTLSLPNVHLYLDAAHAGWLGWPGNRVKIAKIFREVLDAAGGPDKIRGFATNISNYNVLRGDEGRKLGASNPCPDELTYVAKLAETLAVEGIAGKGFVVDTGRNGRAGVRSSWGNWCNIAGAGLGERPRVAPAPGVDAFLWIKPPGASDGTSDPKAARFDPNCRSSDAAADAPEAGEWFPAYFLQLVKNATPAL